MPVVQFKQIGVNDLQFPIYNLEEVKQLVSELADFHFEEVRKYPSFVDANDKKNSILSHFVATHESGVVYRFNLNSWFIVSPKHKFRIVEDRVFREHYSKKRRIRREVYRAKKIRELETVLEIYNNAHARNLKEIENIKATMERRKILADSVAKKLDKLKTQQLS